jgi:hypothetical protein
MAFEDFHGSAAEPVNADHNSKLFECGYSEKPPAKESTETPEQRVDQKIKDSFGADVLDHLKDWDWLIDNRKKLEDGFKKATGQDAWDMAQRMKELSKVDGRSLIYLSKVDGPTHGTLIPKRYDVYLRRGSFRSDNEIGHVYH